MPLYLHAPDFYATALLQPIAVLGTVLLALRVVDAFQDLIGALSDRYSAYRLEIVFAGTVLLLVGFAGLFNPAVSPLPDGLTLVWFALCIFLCTTGFSIVTINYQALGGLWDVPLRDRTKVTGIREAFGLLGVLTASILPAILQARSDPAQSFSLLSILPASGFFGGVWLFVCWYRGAGPATARHPSAVLQRLG